MRPKVATRFRQLNLRVSDLVVNNRGASMIDLRPVLLGNEDFQIFTVLIPGMHLNLGEWW